MTPDERRDGVLVLDADGQCGLSLVRSLGRKGLPVTAGAAVSRSLGSLSRYSDAAYTYPDPATDAGAFRAHLQDHLDRRDYDVVIPADDHTSLLLARHAAEFEATGTAVAVEDWPTFERAYDKALLFDTIESRDVPAPATYAPTSLDEVAAVAESIDYPAVVKPRSKSHFRDDECVTTLISDDNYVDSPAELERIVRRFVETYADVERRFPIVQSYVPGTTTTTVALAADGVIGPYFQEERLRTYPASGGNSALLAALDEPRMLEYAERVLGALDWTGPAMVEFMRTPEDEYVLIEVNGRYWGSLPFAIASGVDFPWFHYLQLSGTDHSALYERGVYRTDIRQRRLFYEDIKWIGEHLAAGNVGALGTFVRDFVRTNHTFVSPDDPLPTMGTLLQGATLGIGALRVQAPTVLS